MSKGQKRKTREARKPKADKPAKSATPPAGTVANAFAKGTKKT